MDRSLRGFVAPILFAFCALSANPSIAELTLEVTISTSTDFAFTVSGDFSGYTPPASLTDFLYLVPMDQNGNPVTTWLTLEQFGSRPDGAINGSTVTGWVFADSDTRSDDFSFLTGDGFNVQFNGGPFDSTAVMTTPYARSEGGFTLNPSDIAYFNLYWGRTVLVASTESSSVEPTPVPALPTFGIAIIILGLALTAARRLRSSSSSRA